MRRKRVVVEVEGLERLDLPAHEAAQSTRRLLLRTPARSRKSQATSDPPLVRSAVVDANRVAGRTLPKPGCALPRRPGEARAKPGGFLAPGDARRPTRPRPFLLEVNPSAATVVAETARAPSGPSGLGRWRRCTVRSIVGTTDRAARGGRRPRGAQASVEGVPTSHGRRSWIVVPPCGSSRPLSASFPPALELERTE